MRFTSALKYDLKFQIRHGFYSAYAFVVTFYLIALLNIPLGIREWVTTMVIFSDTSVLGFFFVGSIILLERGQGTLNTLFVTPIRLHEFLLSKSLSLTALAVLVSAGIVVISTPFAPLNPYFFFGVICSSLFYTLIGLGVAAKSATLNGYIFRGVAYTILFFLPLVHYFHLFESPIFWLLPTLPVLNLIDSLYLYHTTGKLLMSAGILLLWTVAAYFVAYRWFYNYVILGSGGGK